MELLSHPLVRVLFTEGSENDKTLFLRERCDVVSKSSDGHSRFGIGHQISNQLLFDFGDDVHPICLTDGSRGIQKKLYVDQFAH